MPRVETVINPDQPPFTLHFAQVRLRPMQISIDPAMQKARPGPEPENEEKLIEALAASMREIGQIVPVVVTPSLDGGYWLVDGRRRLTAALTLDSDKQPFELDCVVRRDEDSLKTAIHANLKRRGYSPLQFAHLCAAIRESNGWTGSKEVAEYLGVSRAQVSQHDKLLSKPEGMTDTAYKDLLGKVNSGKMGADAAFYALTHVEPEKASPVLARAGALAAEEAGVRVEKNAKASQIASNARESASQKGSKTAKPPKLTAAQQKQFREAAKKQREAHKKRVAEAKAKAKIEKKHLKQAAAEQEAVRKAERSLHKTLPDLRVLLDKLRTAAFPDCMRNFISILAEAWFRGDASDKDVIAHWTQIAMLVEQQIEKQTRGSRRGLNKAKKPIKPAKRVVKAKSKK